MSPIMSGLISGLVLSVVLVLYALLRGRVLVTFFRKEDEQIAKLPETVLFWIALGSYIIMGIVFGLVAGLVYYWVGLPVFTYVAFGAAVLLSLLALLSKTPLAGDKIAWNLSVGLTLGLLVPLLAA